MKYSKKICLFFIALMMVCSFSFAQKKVIKIASVAPARSPWDIEQKKLAQELAKATNGELTMQFYDVNALGGENGVIQKMRLVRPGQRSPLDGAVLTSIGVYELAPKSNVLTLSVPFLFRNQNELTQILDAYYPDINNAIEEKGFKLLGWYNVGWAHFFTKKEVRTPKELKSIKLSVGGITSPALGRAFQYAGYTTEDVPNDKIMQSVKSANGIQGLYTIPMYSYAAQYYKSLTYAIGTPLCPVMAGFIISKATWDSIPDKYKDVFASIIKSAEKKFIDVQQANDESNLVAMEKDGLTRVVLTDEEVALWEKELTADAQKMATIPGESVINFDFFSKIEADLKKIRKEK
ncbi:MAG: ABC transporter substrate-binding protein [Spirochaetaceae bacterium]|nr:ABC transporter substrate-binding protein [Spirochaetaceae bacterium]